MPSRYLLVVQIWLQPGEVTRFEEFERMAARIMAKYDGRIERAVRLDPTGGGAAPFEIHLVSFPDADAFARYKADPETHGLAALRAAIIARTELYVGRDVAAAYG